MAILLFSNNATTTLAGAITNTATTVNLAAGTGALFPSPTTGQYFVATFTDAATGLLNEIVWVTSITGDTATIQRAKEGTTAQSWNVNDIFANLWTAGQAGAMAQWAQVSTANSIYYGSDAGTSNAAVVTVSPVPTGYANGAVFVVKKSNSANTGAMTANIASLGSVPVVGPDGTALAANQWPANARAQMVYDSASASLFLVALFPTATANGGLSFTAEGAGALNYGNLPAPVGAMATTDGFAVKSTADSKIVLQPLSTIIAALGTLPGRLLATSGYQIFPGGFILQWITGPTDASGTGEGVAHTISWPITFPTACLAAGVFTNLAASGNADIFYQTYAVSASQVSYLRDIIPNGTNTVQGNGVVFGVGY